MIWVSVKPLALGVMLLAIAQPETAVLRSVRIEQAASSSAAVVIEAGGPLPTPSVGVLDGPPRVFLDFPGVARGTTGTSAHPPGVVRRVRVGAFQLDPLITRVVIDLSEPSPHRLDISRREQGLITVIVGAAGSGGTPKATQPGTETVDSGGGKTVTAPISRRAASPTPTVAERNKAAALSVLAQLERLRPILAAIDSRTDMPEASLRAAIEELDTIRGTLAAAQPGPSQESLIKICVLGATAAATRIEAQQREDPSRAWNAASAAAGALIMLDRVRAELKSP